MAIATTTDAPLLGEALPVELMNTIWADRSGIHDALATSAELVGWLGAVAPRLTPDRAVDLEQWLADPSPPEVDEVARGLRRLRDALRRLAAAQTADPRTRAGSAMHDLDEAVRTVNLAAAAAPHWRRLQWSPVEAPSRSLCTDAGAGESLTALLAEQAIDLFTDERRGDLRACLAPGCVLYFVKQHPRREWCSTACGNRARAARHYQRHRHDPEP